VGVLAYAIIYQNKGKLVRTMTHTVVFMVRGGESAWRKVLNVRRLIRPGPRNIRRNKMTTAPSPVSVLRMATSSSNTQIVVDLCKAIEEYFPSIQPIQPLSLLSSSTTSSALATPLPQCRFDVSNKYFDAAVEIHFVDCLANDGTQPSSSIVQHANPTIDALPLSHHDDGVILLFESHVCVCSEAATSSLSSDYCSSLSSRFAFDSLQSVHDCLNNHYQIQKLGDLLRLCVGVTYRNPLATCSHHDVKLYEKEYSRRVLWCLDHGFEYVEVDLSEAGKQQGHDERDKEGFARVVEALAGTVWTSAINKSRPITHSSSLSKNKSISLLGNYVASDQHSTAMPSNGETKIDSLIESSRCDNNNDNDNSISVSSACSSMHVSTCPAAHSQHYEAVNTLQETHVTVKENPNRPPGVRETESQHITDSLLDVEEVNDANSAHSRRQEHIFNQFESTLQEAARIRELSKSGMMSNEERRERAGNAASLLMSLLEQMGCDDDGSDDEERDEPLDSLECSVDA
jgi:hypothetical protein